jgi:hypothetical protein
VELKMTTKPEQSAGPRERDGAIERLERAAAAERQNATALRKAAEELRFKLDVLEKGYAKQLADARARAERAESEAAALRERWAAVGEDASQALERLAAARIELAAVSAERDRCRDAPRGGANGGNTGAAAPAVVDTGLTINNLMTEIEVLRAASPAPDVHSAPAPSLRPSAPNVAANEKPMLAPELVFSEDSDEADADADAQREG